MKALAALGLAAACLLASPAFAGQAASECVTPKTASSEADVLPKTTSAEICRAS
jgi:hypothetical protein